MNRSPLRNFIFLCGFLFGYHSVEAGINDARFQKLFRSDLTNVTRISWKEWVKKYVQSSNGFPTIISPNQKAEQIACSNGNLVSKHTTKGACCDVSNDTCDASANLQCIDYRCSCKVGSFLNENTNKCEQKNNKQLADTCTANVDNCYTAFSVCISGICQCMSGFKPDGLECVPSTFRLVSACEGGATWWLHASATWRLYVSATYWQTSAYRCPYGDPLMSGARPRPCDVRESDTAAATSGEVQCPTGYECVYPADPYRPKYITLAGTEQGYCCPRIPDLNRSILFQDQCYLGDWVSPLDCPPSTHVYAFAISTVPLCCPKPCRPNYSSTIVSGQCLENILQ